MYDVQYVCGHIFIYMMHHISMHMCVYMTGKAYILFIYNNYIYKYCYAFIILLHFYKSCVMMFFSLVGTLRRQRFCMHTSTVHFDLSTLN